MATILAQANGNFTSTGTWSGGIVPSIGDIAVANGFTVTITSNIDCAELKNDTTSGASNGGKFTSSVSGIIIKANIFGASSSTTDACLEYTGTGTGYIEGNIVGGILATGVSHTGTGNLEITGNVSAGSTYGVYSTSTGYIIINGNVTGGDSNVNSQAYACIRATALSSITINGNLGTGVRGIHGLRFDSTGTITVNGNAISNCTTSASNNPLIYCLFADNSPTSVVITGNIQTTSRNFAGNGVYIKGVSSVTVDGEIIKIGNYCRGLYVIESPSCIINIGNKISGVGNRITDYPALGIVNSPTATVTIQGNLEGCGVYLQNSSSCNITINGDIIGSSDTNTIYPLYLYQYNNSSTIVVNGNIYGNAREGIYAANGDSSGITLNIFGNIYAGITPGVRVDEDYSFNFYCNSDEIVASEFNNALYFNALYSGNVTVEARRLLNHSNGMAAIFARYFTFIPKVNSYIRYASTGIPGSVDEYLYHHAVESLSAFSMPPVSAVRAGVTYANGSLTGTCVIPEVSSVMLGVEVDSGKFGTAYFDNSFIDYSKLWNSPITTTYAPSSFGERLKNSISIEGAGKVIQSFGL